MPVLALLAPFGAVILSLLLAVAFCYAAAYAGLWQCFRRSGPRSVAGSEALKKVVVDVSVLGLQIEGETGVTLTIKDQQHTLQQAVLQFIRSYGYRHSNIYSAFSNPEMRLLLLPGVGCMAYTTAAHWGLKVVVATGDPVCDPQHDLLMLETFKAVFPDSVMLDVSKEVAMLWAGQEAKQPGPAMTVTDMGTEIILDVMNYSFEFNKKTKKNRRNAEQATQAGLVVEELTAHSSEAVREQVQQLAGEWHDSKEVTGDMKVFSRIIPFQHLGRETDARVFIARTLQPGEPAPFTVAMATEKLQQKKAATATEGDTITSSPGQLSKRQQRRLDFLEKRRAKNSAYQQQQQQQQQQCTSAAGPDSAAAAADTAVAADTAAAAADTAAAADSSVSDITIDVACDIELQEKKQQQQKTPGSSTAASSSGSSSGGCGSSASSASSSQIHACVILDPIYRLGEVVGYVVQRTYVSPQHVQGAPKLVLKDVLGLLKAEGRDILAHGLSPAHDVKSGAYHGFSDCAWMRRAMQLCYEYGNSLYAFKNLAMSKTSWGGGYNPEDDSIFFKKAVTLNRRFVLLPASWSFQLSHGPMLLLVFFRHVGLLVDPWELFAFWRFW